jgi:hypothetical protein
MKRIKLFESFNYDSIYNTIIQRIPDSDIPNQTNIIEEINGYIVYTEGWCDRCFSNYDVYDRHEMVELAKKLTEKRLRDVPNLPQYKNKFDGKLRKSKLVDFKFIEFPDNDINYGVSIGIYRL